MRRRLLAMLALTAFVAVACGDEDASAEVVVFAAASLADAFSEIGAEFTEAHPDRDVTFNFAASSELVTQIDGGAPADVFASADPANMTKLTDAGAAAAAPVPFATNVAEIIVAPGNPRGIAGLADLTNEDLQVVVCAPEVPCGRYAAEVFARGGVSVTPVSLEENVRAVVTKVRLGEADAGIVYATDIDAAGGDAAGVAIPDEANVLAEYQIAATREAPDPEGAAAFVDFVTGDDGQRILARYGFGSP